MEDWRELPNHLLDLILDKLSSSIDSLQFKAVCESWCEVMMQHKVKRLEYYEHQVPMLLVPNEREDSWQVYDVVERKFSEARLNIAHKMRFCGSSHGWLASVNEDYTVTLHRPYFGVNKDGNDVASTISLPPLYLPELTADDIDSEDEDFNRCEYYVSKICITANPQLQAKDCIVFVILERKCELAFIRYKKDTTWTKMTSGGIYDDMMWLNNRLYAVNYLGVLECFEVPDDADKPVRKSIVAHGRPLIDGKRYLAATFDKEILLIDRHFSYVDCDPHPCTRLTSKIEVFKLDSHNKKWNNEGLLGDVSLFLGDNTSILVRSSDFLRCCPNCIYLTHDIDYTGDATFAISDVGIFDLKTQKLTLSFGLDPNAFQRLVRRPPIWIIP